MRNSARMFSPSRPSAFSLSSSAFSNRPCQRGTRGSVVSAYSPPSSGPPALYHTEDQQRWSMGEDQAQRGGSRAQGNSSRSRASVCPAKGAAKGHWQVTGGEGPSHSTGMSSVTQTGLFYICLRFRTPWTDSHKGTSERKCYHEGRPRTECARASGRLVYPEHPVWIAEVSWEPHRAHSTASHRIWGETGSGS